MNLHRSAYDYLPVGIAALGFDGKIRYANAAFCSTLAYQATELNGLDFISLIHPSRLGDADGFRQAVLRRPRTMSGRNENTYRRKDGKEIIGSVSFTSLLDEIIIVFEDITERLRSESLLRDQRQVLEMMAEKAPLKKTLARIANFVERQAPGSYAAIYLINDGKFRIGAAPSLPEETSSLIEGSPIGPQSGACGAAAFLGKRVLSPDIETDYCWGAYRGWVLSLGFKSSWSTPVLSKENKVIATVGVSWKERRKPSDWDEELVSAATKLIGLAIERHTTDELLSRQQIKLISSSKMASLGEMASGLAHEINNPLAIIHGAANQLNLLAKKDLLSIDHVNETAELIKATSMRISKIIKGLRSFAREGELDPFQECALKDIFEDTLGLCAERFRNHSVKLSVPNLSPELKLQCRPVQISQILLNLLNNSYEAVQESPLQTQRTRAQKWIDIEVIDSGTHVAFAVTDSGPGISPEIKDKIMQPFFTTKEIGKGTGLGLSIASGIISAHNGEFSLDTSSPFTRFVVKLPKRQLA